MSPEPGEGEPRPPSESRRRFATVVFADVSGFTALARRLDPEELADAMNRCFHVLEEVVTAHGGHVDKYIGDCIMALFGVPQALEDAARQAVNASIEMRNRIVRFNEEQHLPERIDVHIGINTGLVLAGDVGGQQKRDFTVMGDTVNTAARLKDARSSARSGWAPRPGRKPDSTSTTRSCRRSR